ncbi:hypothetical protein, partial [Citreimonas sp.]|uniref:hypothetical protein n=1 Tax=Citreimonas sp. TaxID=3036715 RepID=UPI0035C805E6
MHDRDRHRPLDRPAERVALYLRAIREFRRLARTAIRGGPTASPAGLAGTFQILRAVHRLRYISADHPGADADGAGFIVMLDPVTPHSKASQIVASLKAHGMPPERIFAPRRVGLLGRLRLQLAAGFVVLKVRPWRRRLQVPELTLVIAALVHARRLARGRSTTVHIGDRSPRRIAFAVGARLAGRRSL